MQKFKKKIEVTPWIAECHDSETNNRAFDSSLDTIENYNELFDFIMPCLWECKADGSIADNTRHTPKLRALADKYNKPWFPLIAGDWQIVDKIINDKTLKAHHIKTLVELLKRDNCLGVDVDYEFLPKESRYAFTEFTKELYDALHQAGKMLSLDLHPKTRPDDHWSIGARAQDWKELVKYADIIHVMCYDEYHYAYYYNDAGPVSTSQWTEAVLTYAASVIPEDKLVIGLPTYASNWNLTNPKKTINIFYKQVQDLLKQYNAKDTVDSLTGQPSFRYIDEIGDEHEVWYEDERTLARKLDVVAKYPIRGVAFWALTIEDQRIWENLKSRLV